MTIQAWRTAFKPIHQAREKMSVLARPHTAGSLSF